MLSYFALGYACREEREQVPQQICDSFAQKVCTTGYSDNSLSI